MKTLDEMIREYRIELYKACDGRIGLQHGNTKASQVPKKRFAPTRTPW